jgi:acetyl esterase/lipase
MVGLMMEGCQYPLSIHAYETVRIGFGFHVQWSGLPPTLMVAGENGVLRDEGEAYARKRMQAGVDVTAVRILGTFHETSRC